MFKYSQIVQKALLVDKFQFFFIKRLKMIISVLSQFFWSSMIGSSTSLKLFNTFLRDREVPVYVHHSRLCLKNITSVISIFISNKI